MSWSNGGLLGVNVLGWVEKEVTPMINPDEDTSASVKCRTIKPKGVVGERKSRRQSREGIAV